MATEGETVPAIVVGRSGGVGTHHHDPKGILKKRGKVMTPEERAKRASASIQWDEMNIIATEHPPDKDYGHMKIEEPKTPYHELIDDDDDDDDNNQSTKINPSDLVEHVLKAQSEQNEEQMKSRWERDTEDSEEDMLTDEGKERQKGFKEWRKAHYNEYAAVQRARELMKEDEEELRRLEEEDRLQQQESMEQQ